MSDAPTDAPLDLDALMALHALTSKGPWEACKENREGGGVCPCRAVFSNDSEHVVCTAGGGNQSFHLTEEEIASHQLQMRHDMDFIAASHYAVPKLVELVRNAYKLPPPLHLSGDDGALRLVG